MFDLLQMWAVIEAIGVICLPLTITVFHNLPDRGWVFTKTLGIAVFAFCVWCPLMIFESLPFNRTFIAGGALILLLVGLPGFWLTRHFIAKLVRSHFIYIIVSELIFLGMVFLLGWLRSFQPDIRSFEMFMDEGFVAAIMRSPHLPPNDMWYSGQGINYYYYAHFVIAFLAKFINQSPSIAFNTGISVYFGLTASNLFGVACNIVAWARHLRIQKRVFAESSSSVATDAVSLSSSGSQDQLVPDVSDSVASERQPARQGERTDIAVAVKNRDVHRKNDGGLDENDDDDSDDDQNSGEDKYWNEEIVRPVPLDLPAESASSVLPSLTHAIPYGIITMVMGVILGNLYATQLWWQNHEDGGSILSYNWFGPSRVLGEGTIYSGTTINEFPAFSFLLSCFHAHVLTLAFTIMAMGLAFNLLLENDRKGLLLFGRGWQIPITLLMTALIIGGLFTMNSWDYPTYMGITLLCILLQQWLAHERRFSVKFFIHLILPVISLVALSLILFIPFYLHFASPASRIDLVNAKLRSSLHDEFLIFGFFAFVFISFLIVSAWRDPLFMRPQDRSQRSVVFLRNTVIVSVALSLADTYLLYAFKNVATFVVMSNICLLAVALLLYHVYDRGHAFVLLLGAVAFFLVAACEIVYLPDLLPGDLQRANTVFKFYFQAWALFAVASGTGLSFVVDRFWKVNVRAPRFLRLFQHGAEVIWAGFALILLAASLVYPLVAPSARLATFDPALGHLVLQSSGSLDGLTYLAHCQPPDQDNDPTPFCRYDVDADYYAIRWINQHISGDPVIVEAYGDDSTLYGRISVFTGLPTIMGWSGHEILWRISWIDQTPFNGLDFSQRLLAAYTIYTNPNPKIVLATMHRYNAQYLYVGNLERLKYPNVNLNRFASFMQVVYNSRGVTIYRVK